MAKATPREKLLMQLCVDLGLCLPPADQERLLAWHQPDARAFTDAVFAAEGMPEPYDLHLWRQVRDRVVRVLASEDSPRT